MARTHLFVAAQKAPFGEAVLGVRIAHELHARGDRIVLLARDALSVLAENSPFRFERLGENVSGIGQIIARAATEARADSVVLLDVASVYMLLKAQGTDAVFVRSLPAPVLGLDVWNLEETGLTWDLAGVSWQHSRHVADVTRRLVPVPFARPGKSPGLYDALPREAPVSADERAEVRADFGVASTERLLFLTSARWQHPSMQAHESGRRLAARFPLLVSELIGRLGTDVRVVHVGPEPYPMQALGNRYTWLAQRGPRRFARVLASADLFLSFNFSATTIGAAIAAAVPVLLGVSSYAGRADEIVAKLPGPVSPALAAWLQETAPIAPFRVWPLGLARFLAPLARDNAYTTAFRAAEVLEEVSFLESMRALLFDEAARGELRHQQATYRSDVAQLPKAADLVDLYLGDP
jgi:hypothetical protein